MHRTRSIASSLVLLALLASSCSRSDDDTEAGPGEETTTSSTEGGEGESDLAEGGFGDLEAVCSEGDASGATAPGVTDTEIHVGTMTDKGFQGIPGLNKEMADAAVAFTEWCNEKGGIRGRKLVLTDIDVRLVEYEARIAEACDRDFALVGGGAVFDEDPNDLRVGCGLVNIAGYVVSPRARVAGLQVQPLPNPVYTVPIGHYLRYAELLPDAINSYGVMSTSLPAVQIVRDQSVEAVTSLGWNVIYDFQYATQGETGWQNFVREMRDKDVKILEFIGQPEGLTQLLKAMDTEGWYPQAIIEPPNFYEAKFATEGGAIAGPTFVRSAFHPFEMASDNKATQDFLDLMAQYNSGGKVALLGAQSISAYLLFAQAAAACGSELTRECLMAEAEGQEQWTGAGLHAPQTPGNVVSSECFLLLSVDADGFHLADEETAPTDGLFNCDPANVLELTRDYGVPKPSR